MINYKTKKVEKIQNIDEHYSNQTQVLLFVNNELHLIQNGSYYGYDGNGAKTIHYIFDFTTKKFVEKHGLKAKHCLNFVYLKSRKVLLYISADSWGLYIHSYCLLTSKWKRYNDNKCIKQSFGCQLTRDETHIIFYPNNGGHLFVLKIQDIDNKDVDKRNVDKPSMKLTLIKSKMKFPETAVKFRTVIMRNLDKEECIVFGFVRKTWRKCHIEWQIFPPQYILKLIQSWYWNDYFDDLHILKDYESGGIHCTINVKHIVDNLFTDT